VVAGRAALVGDAAGYLDPITGEGMALAFAQAFALVDAVAAGDLRRYARAHRRIGRLPLLITRLLLVAEARPPLRRKVVAALADPGLFGRVLGLTAGQVGAMTGAPRAVFALGWRLATARVDGR
jgi:2-polyprenyl-6-methoxyphenol hydroxylase-like FAD-dependent oxidoreductase